MTQYILNPAARGPTRHPPVIDPHEYSRVASFYTSHPELQATPLHRLPALASTVGLGDIWLKDESGRFGLNAFKILGVLYAFERLLTTRPHGSGVVIACASAGNHGRAVARASRMRGLAAKVYLPAGAAPARVHAIAGEGAEVIVTDVGYEGTIRQVMQDAEEHGWLIVSDTSWPGYDEVPKWIMAGYSWLFEEAAAQWAAPPDAVFVQAGVGGLACAAASWLAWKYRARRPFVVACEPSAAACLLESARAGRPVAVADEDTMMACLRCAEISPIIWPTIEEGFDAFVAVDDAHVARVMRQLAHPEKSDPAVVAGASGACGLGALHLVMHENALGPVREAAGLGIDSRVLVINSEGATDPVLYESIVRS